ncbi:MAG: hypothetical protein WA666_08930 [Nitrospirota bacterium]
MNRIGQNDFLEFIKTREGEILRTLTRAMPFTVKVTNEGVEYTPQSTMKVRQHPKKYMNLVLEKFSKTGSYKTVDYQQITACSSYTLTLIAEYLKQR